MMRTQRFGAALPLALLLGFEVLAIAGLSSLGSTPSMQVPWGDLSSWVNTASIDEVAAPIIRVAALAIAYWMFASTALTVLAQVSRVPAAIRATSLFTLPSVRRIVDGAMVFSIATTSAVGVTGSAALAQTDTTQVSTTIGAVSDELSVPTPRPTGANAVSAAAAGDEAQETEETTTTTEAPSTTTSTPAATTSSLPSGDTGGGAVATPRPSTNLSTTTTTTAPPASTSTTAAPAAAEAAEEVAEEAAETASEAPTGGTEVLGASEHRVVPGDNLWTIASAALVDAGNADPTEAEIRDYWLKVIDANRDNLRSNDPHWIFPGEIIQLPAIDAAG